MYPLPSEEGIPCKGLKTCARTPRPKSALDYLASTTLARQRCIRDNSRSHRQRGEASLSRSTSRRLRAKLLTEPSWVEIGNWGLGCRVKGLRLSVESNWRHRGFLYSCNVSAPCCWLMVRGRSTQRLECLRSRSPFLSPH